MHSMDSPFTHAQYSALETLHSIMHIPFQILDYDGAVAAAFPPNLSKMLKPSAISTRNDTLGKSSYPNGVTIVELGKDCFAALCKLNADFFLLTCPIARNGASVLPAYILSKFITDTMQKPFLELLDLVPATDANRAAQFCSLAKFIVSGQNADGTNFYRMEAEQNEIEEQRTGSANAKYNESTNRAIAFIRQNLFRKISMDDLTHSCGINRNSLSRFFRADTGIRIFDFITRERLAKAQELLMQTEMPTSDIASLLCFTDQSHLIRVFKQHFGVTPSQYKKNVREL